MDDATQTTRIRLLDSTLRDGSHGIRHRYTPEQVELIAGRLDEAGVHAIAHRSSTCAPCIPTKNC